METHAAEMRDLAFGLIRVLDGDGEAVGPWIPELSPERALSMESADDSGFVRVVARADDHRLLGFAAVGRNVSELSGEMTALIEMGAVLEDVAAVIHAHPTQSEMLQEVCRRALGHAIHI